MTNQFLFSFILCVLLLWRIPVMFCESIDTSTMAFCEGSIFPLPGHRICYRRTVFPNECQVTNCTLEPIGRTEGEIIFRANQTKIASPRFYREEGQYQNRRLCQYNVEPCPVGTIGHIQWSSPNFNLEPPLEIGSSRICTDFVSIDNIDLANHGLDLDSSNLLCGNQPNFSLRISGLPLKAEFFSDTVGRFKGFRIDFFCAPIEFQVVDDTESRRRRFASPINERGDGKEISPLNEEGIGLVHRKRRFVGQTKMLKMHRGMQVPTRMTAENCTEVISPAQPTPAPVAPPPIPQTGNKLSVPRLAYLSYEKKILNVVQDGKVLRMFYGIRRLFFWTGFNGTRVFAVSANVPKNEIFGGGRLLIIKDCAYYVNFLSPPRLEPNCLELDIISILVEATTPFFENQDIEDDEEDDPLPTTPPPRPNIYPKLTTPPPTTKPGADRVNLIALNLAMELENSCNIFLRQAARSLLRILREEGIIIYH